MIWLYRDLYWKEIRVSSSITSGRTKRYDLPLRGTSTATGRMPATRRRRLNTFCDAVFNCAAWFLFTISSMRRLLSSAESVPVTVTTSLAVATSSVVPVFVDGKHDPAVGSCSSLGQDGNSEDKRGEQSQRQARRRQARSVHGNSPFEIRVLCCGHTSRQNGQVAAKNHPHFGSIRDPGVISL